MPDPNILVTPKNIAALVLPSLGNRLNVAKNLCRAMDKEYGRPPNKKPGDTVQVRKPYRFVGGEGLAWDPEPLVDQVTPITVNSVPHVHFQWDSIQKTMSLREAMRIYVDPVTDALANKINAGAATWAANNALNSVGTPGVKPTSPLTYLTAGDVLVELGLPSQRTEKLTCVVNRQMSSAYVNGTTSLLNPSGIISKQYTTGQMQNSLGYEILLDQTINQHVNGTFGGTPLVNTGSQQADGGNNAQMTLITDGWTSGGTSLKLGDKFTIGSATSATQGGVESVHPQTRVTTGRQQVFTVMADVSDSTGAISMLIAPAITPSGQYQNVNSAPVDNAIITMIGTSGGTATQGLLFDENAFAFVTVPINEPDPGMGAKVTNYTDEETGLVISHVAYFDGNQGVEKHKFQALVGYGNLYRELACVIQA